MLEYQHHEGIRARFLKLLKGARGTWDGSLETTLYNNQLRHLEQCHAKLPHLLPRHLRMFVHASIERPVGLLPLATSITLYWDSIATQQFYASGLQATHRSVRRFDQGSTLRKKSETYVCLGIFCHVNDVSVH